MKRCIVKLIVFLLLGAIVNVAVAWVGQIPYQSQPFPQQHIMNAASCQQTWQDLAPSNWPRSSALFGCEYANTLWSRQRVSTSNSLQTGFEIVRTVCGWPCDAMRGISLTTPFGGNEFRMGDLHLGYYRSITLPHDLIWPGFTINTLFYAAILWGGWGLFAAPFGLRGVRRRRRIKRGLCPKCAYDLRGCASQKCPECGAEMIKQKAETQKAEMS